MEWLPVITKETYQSTLASYSENFEEGQGFVVDKYLDDVCAIGITNPLLQMSIYTMTASVKNPQAAQSAFTFLLGMLNRQYEADKMNKENEVK